MRGKNKKLRVSYLDSNQANHFDVSYKKQSNEKRTYNVKLGFKPLVEQCRPTTSEEGTIWKNLCCYFNSHSTAAENSWTPLKKQRELCANPYLCSFGSSSNSLMQSYQKQDYYGNENEFSNLSINPYLLSTVKNECCWKMNILEAWKSLRKVENWLTGMPMVIQRNLHDQEYNGNEI